MPQKEVARSSWARFCKQFSAQNQYRPAALLTSNGQVELGPHHPLLGVSLTKKGRLIDGIQILAAGADAEQIAEPVFELKEPGKILVEKDKQGRPLRVEFQAQNNSGVKLEFHGDPDSGAKQALVEKIAYNLHQRRGQTHGAHFDDWVEAERRLQAIESQLRD
jgi:hypothetical protein